MLARTFVGTRNNGGRYYVDGIEDSICTDAPGDIWFVIVGFAVVSVGLFVVAVSFRLLLQQKEVCRVTTDDFFSSLCLLYLFSFLPSFFLCFDTPHG